jgi:hypothetical protein
VEPGDVNECWLWKGRRNKKFKYGYIDLTEDGKSKQLLAHRIAYEINCGPIPEGLQVCHKCDNPPCVNHHHLFVGTALDNSRDCISKGRNSRGERAHGAKLTANAVIEIRKRAAAGEKFVSIGKDYNINSQHVGRIVRKERWAHV